QLWFSEPVAPFGGGIRVLGPSGRRVEHGPARADGGRLWVDVDAHEDGTYLVRWQVIARDTHPSRGAFAFSVGHPDAVPRAAALEGLRAEDVSTPGLLVQRAGRWTPFAGYALGFGPLAFALLVLRPAKPADRMALRALTRLAGAGVALLLAAEALALLAQTASLAPERAFAPDAI